MENKRPVYVVGHKNPDTDSICSAIAYSYLKNQLNDGKRYEAKRAGRLNMETKFVLEKFDMPIPEYITSVEPQVKDVAIDKVPSVSKEISLKKAYMLMKKNKTVTLAVIRENDSLEGVISLTDIAESDMDMYDSRIVGKAKTSLKNIIEAIDGNLVIGEEENIIDKGKVLIAAANPDVMENYIEDGDLVILGNRYESQLCAIEMNADCLIVCEGASVSKTISKLARDRGCSIITTKHDTYTTARLVNQSMPISHFMARDNLITFRIDEPIEGIRGIMSQMRFRNFPILDRKNRYIGMISRRNILNINKKEIILVDHNELKQAVDGANNADILEIIDHHRLGTMETAGPVFFRCQPLGCTSTIVFQMYREQNIDIPKEIASLMLAAIISDTLMFRSPTCTALDKDAAHILSDISNVNIEKFATEMFNAGSKLDNMGADEIFFQDFKKFNIGELTLGVGQINSINSNEFINIKDKVVPYINENLGKLGVNMIFFLMTSILDGNSDVIYAGERALEVLEGSFDKLDVIKDEERVVIEGLVSRKKQFIPGIIAYLQQN